MKPWSFFSIVCFLAGLLSGCGSNRIQGYWTSESLQHDWTRSFPYYQQLNWNASDAQTSLRGMDLKFDSDNDCTIAAFANRGTYYAIRRCVISSSELVMPEFKTESGAISGEERFTLELKNGKLTLTDSSGKRDVFRKSKEPE